MLVPGAERPCAAGREEICPEVVCPGSTARASGAARQRLCVRAGALGEEAALVVVLRRRLPPLRRLGRAQHRPGDGARPRRVRARGARVPKWRVQRSQQDVARSNVNQARLSIARSITMDEQGRLTWKGAHIDSDLRRYLKKCAVWFSLQTQAHRNSVIEI